MAKPTNSLAPRLGTLAAIVAAVATVYLARELLIPLALAAFAALLLQPLVGVVQRRGLPRVAAVVVVMGAALAPIAGVGWAVLTQSASVLQTLPSYRSNIEKKLESIRGPVGRQIGQGTALLKQLRGAVEEATKPEEGASTDTPGTPAPTVSAPMPVTVVESAPSPFTLAREFAGPIIRPLAMLGMVVVLVMFFLVFSEDVRDRIIRLLSASRLTTTTSALDEVGTRIGSFLRAQFLVNAGTGVVIAAALWALGVPNALLWGFLGGALRFIPYIGAIFAASLPILLSIAVSDSWAQPLGVVAFFLVFETLSNNVIEPWVYGKRTGISPLALLISTIFWGWLWGLWGLLLSTQLTVCLMVAGRYVAELRFLEILLGDQPALTPEEKFYQRLLAMDADEAAEIGEEYLKNHTLAETFEKLYLPALARAEIDREAGALDEERRLFLLPAVRELAEDAAGRMTRANEAARAKVMAESSGAPGGASAPGPAARRVLCVPARDEADAIAARMIELLAAETDLVVRALTVENLGTDLGAIIAEFKPTIVLVSSVPPHASIRARARVRQILVRAPGDGGATRVRMMAGLWGAAPAAAGSGASGVRDHAGRTYERLREMGVERVVGTLAEALLAAASAPAEPPAKVVAAPPTSHVTFLNGENAASGAGGDGSHPADEGGV